MRIEPKVPMQQNTICLKGRAKRLWLLFVGVCLTCQRMRVHVSKGRKGEREREREHAIGCLDRTNRRIEKNVKCF
jgi:hypothetical protein